MTTLILLPAAILIFGAKEELIPDHALIRWEGKGKAIGTGRELVCLMV